MIKYNTGDRVQHIISSFVGKIVGIDSGDPAINMYLVHWDDNDEILDNEWVSEPKLSLYIDGENADPIFQIGEKIVRIGSLDNIVGIVREIHQDSEKSIHPLYTIEWIETYTTMEDQCGLTKCAVVQEENISTTTKMSDEECLEIIQRIQNDDLGGLNINTLNMALEIIENSRENIKKYLSEHCPNYSDYSDRCSIGGSHQRCMLFESSNCCVLGKWPKIALLCKIRGMEYDVKQKISDTIKQLKLKELEEMGEFVPNSNNTQENKDV
jgi:hypothetical protein